MKGQLSREDFVKLVREMKKEITEDSKAWANNSLPLFLEAIAAWTEDMDGYYENKGEKTPYAITWDVLTDILMAARTYE
jgi:hypothetical protein